MTLIALGLSCVTTHSLHHNRPHNKRNLDSSQNNMIKGFGVKPSGYLCDLVHISQQPARFIPVYANPLSPV